MKDAVMGNTETSVRDSAELISRWRGAGSTSYSMLQTLTGAYKLVILGACAFNAFDGFYLATLGNARGIWSVVVN